MIGYLVCIMLCVGTVGFLYICEVILTMIYMIGYLVCIMLSIGTVGFLYICEVSTHYDLSFPLSANIQGHHHNPPHVPLPLTT